MISPSRGDIENAQPDPFNPPRIESTINVLQKLKYFFEESFLKATSSVRNLCLRIVSDTWFERAVISVIVLNSILMSMPDYNHVTNKNELSATGSPINALIIESELAFTIVFTLEFVLKATAFGLFSNNLAVHRKPYFRDAWNWLDFLVVAFAWLENMQVLDSKSIKVFRLFRVLRPLKSIKSLPAVAAIVTGTLNSMGELRDILLTVLFSFFFFAVVGLQIFIGPYLHTRCRLTPFPVNTTWTATISAAYLNHTANYPYELDYNAYRCLDAPNFDYPEQYTHWQQRDSPWFTPQSHCYWPYNMYDKKPQVCSLTGTGTNVCVNGYDSGNSPDLWTWCGSNYDALGNARFNPATAFWDTYYYSLGYQFVNFDHFGYAFLFVIQVFSGDSWSFMMYKLTDAIGNSIGYGFCCLIVLFGNFFLLQLNVALLQKTFKSKSHEVLELSDHDSTVVEPVVVKPKYKTAIQAYVSSKNLLSDHSISDARVQPFSDEECSSFSAAMNDSESLKADSSQPFLPSTDNVVNEARTKLEQKNHTKAAHHYWAAEMSMGLLNMLKKIIQRIDKPEQNSFRRFCKLIYTNRAFEIISLIVVLCNASILAYNHYGIDPTTAHYMDAGQYLITIFAVFESSLGLLGNGILVHLSENFVLFDTIVVLASSISTFLSPVPCAFTNAACTTDSSLGSVIALRSLRVFMIFRVLKLKFAKMVLHRITIVAKSMQNFLVVLFLFVFLFALIGMHVYANRFRFDARGFAITAVNSPEWLYAPDRPRSSFDNFTLAFLSVFQIITIDNWSTVMFNGGRALGPWGVMHPTVCFLLGTFFVTNLFLAMLVDSFLHGGVDHEVDGVHGDQVEAVNKSSDSEGHSSPNIQVDMSAEGDMLVSKSALEGVKINQNQIYGRIKALYEVISKGEHLVAHEFLVLCAKILSSEAFEWGITALVCISCISMALDNPLNDPNSSLVTWLYYIDLVVTVVFSLEFAMKVLVFGAVHKRTEHSAYFLDGWNILDFVVVVVSIMSVSVDKEEGGSIGVLRVLRSLRPLKIIQRIPGLRIIVLSLIIAIPSVAEVGIIVLLIYFIFGVFFLSFLSGQLRSCNLPFALTSQQYAPQLSLLQQPIPWADYSNEQRSWFGPGNNFTTGDVTCSSWPSQPCCAADMANSQFKLNSRFICECWGGSWDPVTDFRFDNIAMSMITLFDSATIDNWTDNMHLVADNNGLDMQPIRDNQMWWYYIYLVFILVGNFVCIQLFVGVIVKSFSDSKGRLSGHLFITDEQLEWVNTAKVLNSIMPKKKYKRPSNSFRSLVFSICEHRIFQAAVAGIIIAQCAVLSMVSFGQSDALAGSLERANVFLAVLFVFEVAMKWMAYGIKVYLSSTWNRLEFFIALFSIGYLLEVMVGSGSFAVVGTIMRTSRFIRIIFIIKEIPSMRKFVDFILLTIPAIGNITILILFCIYIFTVVGVNLFAKIGYNNSYYANSNFRTFKSGFVTLFRMTTADNWGQYMYDMSKSSAGCVVDPPYNASYCGFSNAPDCVPLNGCGSVISFPFWIIYIILMTFVLLSVFISVIISNYSDLQDGTIRPQDMRAFTALWTEFDPDATCLLQLYQLKEFVGKLYEPMGFGGRIFSERQYLRRVGKIKLLIKKKDYVVHFHDVITVLSAAQFEKKVLWNKEIIFNVDNVKPNGPGPAKRLSITTRQVQYSLAHDSLDYFTVHHLYCAIRIQKQWKYRKMQSLGITGPARFAFYQEALRVEEAYGKLRSKKMTAPASSPQSSTHSLREVPVVGEMKLAEEELLAPPSPSSLVTATNELQQQHFVFPDPEQDLTSVATFATIYKNDDMTVWSEGLLNQLPFDEDDVAVVTEVRQKPSKKRRNRRKDRELPTEL